MRPFSLTPSVIGSTIDKTLISTNPQVVLIGLNYYSPPSHKKREREKKTTTTSNTLKHQPWTWICKHIGVISTVSVTNQLGDKHLVLKDLTPPPHCHHQMFNSCYPHPTGRPINIHQSMTVHVSIIPQRKAPKTRLPVKLSILSTSISGGHFNTKSKAYTPHLTNTTGSQGDSQKMNLVCYMKYLKKIINLCLLCPCELGRSRHVGLFKG